LNNSSIVCGNYEDKYRTRNLISRFLVNGFLAALNKNLSAIPTHEVKKVSEIGCADGELIKHIHTVFENAQIDATDISEKEILKAKTNCASIPVNFSIQNAENLDKYRDSGYDLVICCEVLEHLENPEQGLSELYRISNRYVLVSVPNEPLWRILNLSRGKYIRSLGNTPGHLNHWSTTQFLRFLQGENFIFIRKMYPLPWQMVLLEKKQQ